MCKEWQIPIYKRFSFMVFFIAVLLSSNLLSNEPESSKQQKRETFYSLIQSSKDDKKKLEKLTKDSRFYQYLNTEVFKSLNIQNLSSYTLMLTVFLQSSENVLVEKCDIISKVIDFSEKNKVLAYDFALQFLRDIENLDIKCNFDFKKRLRFFDYMTEEYFNEFCVAKFNHDLCARTISGESWKEAYKGCNRTVECRNVQISNCGYIYINNSFGEKEKSKVEKICQLGKSLYDFIPNGKSAICRDGLCVPEDFIESYVGR